MALGDPLVVICALKGRLYPEVELAMAQQAPNYRIHWDEPHPARTYGEFIRLVWAGYGDLIINEGDCVAPPGAVEDLLRCPERWCCHPNWLINGRADHTFGLVKFSRDIQLSHPKAADEAMLRGDHHRHHRYPKFYGLPEPAPLGPVPVEDAIAEIWPELDQRSAMRWQEPRATTSSLVVDVALVQRLEAAGEKAHVHSSVLWHLRYPQHRPEWVDRWQAAGGSGAATARGRA